MHAYSPYLDWITTRHEEMCRRVVRWCNINTGTENVAGLIRLAAVLGEDFAGLGAEVEELTLPPASSIDSRGHPVRTPLGPALRFTKRHAADRPLRVLLNIHMDTVYPADHPFQAVSQLDANTLRGPGVLDAKGGLAVLLTTLEAFERSPWAEGLGWEVLINPDEEIGSPGSHEILARCARDNDFGLLFEPAMSDGSLVSRRRGTGNFTVVLRGRSAHAGRDFERGRSAIVAMAEMVTQLNARHGPLPGATVTVGRVEGGGAVNVVPDLAILRLNLRAASLEDEAWVGARVKQIVAAANAKEGITAELFGSVTSPPKLPDARTRPLMELIEACGRELSLPITWRDSGGASDGNKLAAAGLPNVDTLGPRGGDIHSPNEVLLLDSLTERARLAALLLMKMGAGEVGGRGVKRET
jgi:glutamate carboxypeptidase